MARNPYRVGQQGQLQYMVFFFAMVGMTVLMQMRSSTEQRQEMAELADPDYVAVSSHVEGKAAALERELADTRRKVESLRSMVGIEEGEADSAEELWRIMQDKYKAALQAHEQRGGMRSGSPGARRTRSLEAAEPDPVHKSG
eukprot:g134.t1